MLITYRDWALVMARVITISQDRQRAPEPTRLSPAVHICADVHKAADNRDNPKHEKRTELKPVESYRHRGSAFLDLAG
jgi:hypothetical protein